MTNFESFFAGGNFVWGDGMTILFRWPEAGCWQEDVPGPGRAEGEGGIPPSGAEV